MTTLWWPVGVLVLLAVSPLVSLNVGIMCLPMLQLNCWNDSIVMAALCVQQHCDIDGVCCDGSIAVWLQDYDRSTGKGLIDGISGMAVQEWQHHDCIIVMAALWLQQCVCNSIATASLGWQPCKRIMVLWQQLEMASLWWPVVVLVFASGVAIVIIECVGLCAW